MSICAGLHELFSRLPRHSFPLDEQIIPLNGLYVLFEEGEKAHGTDRIVRIGTHTGADQLRSRLRQHFLTENKDRSIFRKNIGRALLQRAGDPFLAQWDVDLTTRTAKDVHSAGTDCRRLKEIEEAVSIYMRKAFSFVVIEVQQKEERLRLESRLISTVSRCSECRPSPHWLGLFSPKEKIRESGLWLVNELYKEPFSQTDFETFKNLFPSFTK